MKHPETTSPAAVLRADGDCGSSIATRSAREGSARSAIISATGKLEPGATSSDRFRRGSEAAGVAQRKSSVEAWTGPSAQVGGSSPSPRSNPFEQRGGIPLPVMALVMFLVDLALIGAFTVCARAIAGAL